MFFSGKDKNPGASQAGRRSGKEPISLISADLSVRGDLISPGDLQIDGLVEGDIQCQSLTIGPTATVSGNVAAIEVLIRGTLHGHIEARSVTLGKTAQVVGDILHETIAIEAGAILDGRLTGRNRVLSETMNALPQADDHSPRSEEPHGALRQAH
ncbi:MAG: hypothetical protein Dbin4_00145 [Alphaproteobacteria bacterium]|nr:hypothetical protein [Alphaproteobacteria bacterium]